MDIIGALLIGLLAGFVGAICTGAGLVSIPGLIFLGASPFSAIATTRLGILSGGLASLYEYNKAKAVLWRYLIYFVGIAVVAGLIGPRLLLLIREDWVEPIIGILLLLMLPMLFIEKDFGIKHKNKKRRSKILGLGAIFFVLIYCTMFGAGGGIFLIYALMYFFGMNVTEANATGTAVSVLAIAVALATYVSRGAVDFRLGIPLMIGSLIGGLIGASLALKEGTLWVKWVLCIVVALSGIKLLFF